MPGRPQVVVVGGGPVGVALAIELGQRGVSCVLVERHLTPQPIPKGQNLTQRTLEHFHFWGLVDRIARRAHHAAGLPDRRRPLRQPDERLLATPRPAASGRGKLLLTQRAPAAVPHRGGAARSVTSCRRHDPVSAGRRGGRAGRPGARVTIARVRRAAHVLAAEYVVGCDGGRSLVRESMGIDRGGRNFDQRMVLAVLPLERAARGPEALPARHDLPGAQAGAARATGSSSAAIDVGEGFFFHAPVPRDATPDNFDFLGLLHEAAGFEFAAEFDHVGFWDLRIMVASSTARAACSSPATPPPAPALRRLRPEHRPRGRREPRLEAGGGAAGLGRRSAAGLLRRGAAPDLRGDRRGDDRRRHRARPRLPGALQPGEGPGGVRGGLGRDGQRGGNRPQRLRAALRGLLRRGRPADAASSIPASTRSPRGRAPPLARALRGPQRLRGAGPGVHPARPRRPGRGARVRGRAAALALPLKVVARHLRGRARAATRRAWCWYGPTSTWRGRATPTPEDLDGLLARVAGRS